MDILKSPEFMFFFFVFGIVSLVAFMAYDLHKEKQRKSKH